MQDLQQKQMIPIKVNSKPLVGSGIEKVIAYNVSESFAYKAEEDGKITEVDEENGIAKIEYASGRKSFIDLRPTMNKHSSGFYLKSQLSLSVKVGEKFKEGQILAVDESFFSNGKNDIEYNLGCLAKVALASSDATYEDSAFVSTKLSNKMATKMVKRKDLVLGPNSNIEYMCKVGDKVINGDVLITFENSFEDDSLNDILKKLGEEFEETVNSLSKNVFRSVINGTVVGIEMYYTCEFDELSDSIKKYLRKYIKENSKVKNLMIQNSDDGINRISMNVPAIDKQNTNKIKGTVVDGIVIFFYIEYEDVLGVGDKVSWYGATKSVLSNVLNVDEMPYSEFRKDEDIDGVFSPLSIVSRNTMDIPKMLYCNKVLIEAKRKMKEIFDS